MCAHSLDMKWSVFLHRIQITFLLWPFLGHGHLQIYIYFYGSINLCTLVESYIILHIHNMHACFFILICLFCRWNSDCLVKNQIGLAIKISKSLRQHLHCWTSKWFRIQNHFNGRFRIELIFHSIEMKIKYPPVKSLAIALNRFFVWFGFCISPTMQYHLYYMQRSTNIKLESVNEKRNK